MKKALFIFFFLVVPTIFFTPVFSQTLNLDSVFNAILRSNKTDSLKLAETEQLIAEGFNEGQYKKTISLAKQGIILSQKFNKQKSKGYFLHFIGKSYGEMAEYQQALSAYQQALFVREEIGDSLGMAKTLGNIGNTYNRISDYAKAVDMILKSIKICEKIKAEEVLKNVLSSLGEIYYNKGEFKKALDYNFRSLKLEEKYNNKIGIGQSLGNIGKAYFFLDSLEKALQYQERSLKIATEENDRGTISNALTAFGEIYRRKKEFDKALEYYSKSKKILEEDGDQVGVLNASLNIGILYTLTNKLKEAEQISNKAIKLSKEFGMIEYEKEAYNNLREIYDKQNKPILSYEAFKRYIILKDSINNEASQKELTEHEMSYEFDKKKSEMKAEEDKRAAIAASESKRQKFVIYGVSVGFILVLMLVGLVYRNLQNNKKKNKIIEQQKLEVEHKQKEILDSILYAQRIQKALLASEALLSENLPEYFVFFKPKDIVSGDFYWATNTNDKFYLITADSTGHGVPGAFMSLLNISFINEAINEKHFDKPHAILNHTRTRLISSLRSDGSEEGGKDGMDCILTAFDFTKKTLEYSAANNGFYIARNNELLNFKADKMPVGKSPRDHESFTSNTIELDKGDIIFMLTDGYPDQFGGPKGKKFKYKPLEEILLANCHLPMQDQKQLLQSSFDAWKGELEQVDDVLIIAVRI